MMVSYLGWLERSTITPILTSVGVPIFKAFITFSRHSPARRNRLMGMMYFGIGQSQSTSVKLIPFTTLENKHVREERTRFTICGATLLRLAIILDSFSVLVVTAMWVIFNATP